MNEEKTVRILLLTTDDALSTRLDQMLQVWAVKKCATIRICRQEQPSDTTWDLVFFDADTIPADNPEMEHLLAQVSSVIISSDPTKAVLSYKWHPAAFLPQVYSFCQLSQAMDRCFAAWSHGLSMLDLPSKRDRILIAQGQLLYAEAEGRDVILHCVGGTIRAGISIGQLETLLWSPPFYRCHKGFLVNIAAVEKLTEYGLLMGMEQKMIPVGRKRIQSLRDAIAGRQKVEAL